MLTWEFPPRIVGGISTHVYELSRALVSKGIDVHVVTCDFPKTPDRETVDGVKIYRVKCSKICKSNFLAWIYYMNSLMIECGSRVLKGSDFDVIHAHDWMVARASVELSDRYNIALVSTIHATEFGREDHCDKDHINNTNKNLRHRIEEDDDFGKTISCTERTLILQSDRVICASKYMRNHISQIFNVSVEDVDVIPNAIDVSRFLTAKNYFINEDVRSNLGLQRESKIILYVGRLVKEKGIYTLIDAFDNLLRHYGQLQQESSSNLRLIIVGEGHLKKDLMRYVCQRRLQRYVHFTGFVDERTKIALYHSSDVCVIPSLYEPFGIVALEAMACGIPIVASDIGGLSEIVENNVTGLKVQAGVSDLLTVAIMNLIDNPSLARQLASNAYGCVKRKYNQELLAEKTISAYLEAVRRKGNSAFVKGEHNTADFLTDYSLRSLLLTLGIVDRKKSKTAGDIATKIKAPEVRVKLVLGRLASQGYVSTTSNLTAGKKVSYHLTESGILGTCGVYS